MHTPEIIPSGYYTRHRLPIRIMVKRLHPPTTPPIQRILVNLNGIREFSSPDLPMSDCDDSTRRIRASGTSGLFLTCCEWGMLAAIVLLSVGLAVAIFLLFTWPRSQMNDSDVVNTCNGSSVNTTSTTSQLPARVQQLPAPVQQLPARVQQLPVPVQHLLAPVQQLLAPVQQLPVPVQQPPARLQQYAYTYLAIATTTRITFALREDQYFFALDDVTVCDTASPSIQLLTNGDFETGSIVPWVYCNPSGSQYSGQVETGLTTMYGYPYVAYSGTDFYLDGAVGAPDYLSQTFSTTIGHTYRESSERAINIGTPPNTTTAAASTFTKGQARDPVDHLEEYILDYIQYYRQYVRKMSENRIQLAKTQMVEFKALGDFEQIPTPAQ
ncbi:unnamed protein product [Rotaria magnacalcarata]|uniref:Uncharacterized protein n=1 Tax=Rotaria magnacalcarata TaxID=392030 RepID=A0A816QSI2_9BILA|nr:unnamed protein product [Rotaria magnacalcarata]